MTLVSSPIFSSQFSNLNESEDGPSNGKNKSWCPYISYLNPSSKQYIVTGFSLFGSTEHSAGHQVVNFTQIQN